jgi:hypothetical protein
MAIFKKTSRRMKMGITASSLCLIAILMLMGSRRGAAPEEPVMAADESTMTAETSTPEPVQTPPRRARRTAAPVSKAVKAETKAAFEAPDASAEDKAAAASLEPITLTGCLQKDDDTFRLKDLEGMNVEKKRSWKSGFLRKGTPKVEIVDASNRLRLVNHVNHRVTVTGTLYEKEMVASSLRMVSSSCDK